MKSKFSKIFQVSSIKIGLEAVTRMGMEVAPNEAQLELSSVTPKTRPGDDPDIPPIMQYPDATIYMDVSPEYARSVAIGKRFVLTEES